MVREINRITTKRTACRTRLGLTPPCNSEHGENAELASAIEILSAVGRLDYL